MHYAVLFLVFILTLPVSVACGQDNGGGFPDFGIDDLGGLGGLGDLGGDGGGGGGIGDGGIGGTSDIGADLEDTRNQGFIGVTSARIQELGFVGASSETSGPALSNGRSFGGGINDSGVQAAAGGGGGGGGINGGFGGGGQPGQPGTGTENGFQVIRQGIRARLVPQINATPVPDQQVASRFQSRLARQPVPQVSGPPFSNQAFFNGSAPSVNVQIQDRTAFLSGFVGTVAERERWERQLRLEPGVYRIVNQIEVAPTR